MSNYHLRDNTISFKAKGLLSMFLSLPKDWNYSVSGLAAISKEGKDGILSGLKELEAAGYLERHRYRSDRGRLGDSEYVIYEVPHHLRLKTISPNPDFPDLENPALEKPAQEKPTLEKPAQENPPQINKLGFSIHNYFFAKGLEQLRPGGIMAFITSRYTLDSKDSSFRKYIAERAELLGAIRLPNNAFKANAGAEISQRTQILNSEVRFLCRTESMPERRNPIAVCQTAGSTRANTPLCFNSL